MDEPDIGLVHQGRGIERVTGTLPAKVARGEAAHLVIDQRKQAIDSRAVSVGQFPQKLRDRLLRRRTHWPLLARLALGSPWERRRAGATRACSLHSMAADAAGPPARPRELHHGRGAFN